MPRRQLGRYLRDLRDLRKGSRLTVLTVAAELEWSEAKMWRIVYVGLEEAASHLAGYQSELVPGLLQTEGYARTLIRAGKPGVDDAEIERRVHVRMARQVLLTRITAPPALDMVLNEAVLRRPVGGEQVMAGQLTRLVEIGELPTVTVRVMPFSAGLHRGAMSGLFVILRFPAQRHRPGDRTDHGVRRRLHRSALPRQTP